MKTLYLVIDFFSSMLIYSQDLIPSNTATHTAVQSGSWFSTSTWDSGTIPGDAVIVAIPSGIKVDYEGVLKMVFTVLQRTVLIKKNNIAIINS